MRRVIIEEPVSRAALWSRRLAVLGILLAALAVVAARSGAVDAGAALVLLVGGLLCGLGALPAALVAAVVIWRTGHPGLGLALAGTALALLLLAFPAYVVVKAAHLPVLNDVSTDWTDPPLFSTAAKAVAERHGATHDLPAEPLRQAQAQAYPGVQPLTLDVPAEEAYRAAVKVVAARRWRVVEQHAPAGRPAVGSIQAIARTTLMGFSDDIAIRVTALSPMQSRIDMRSASRIGRGDLGANAERLESLATAIEDAADE